MNVMLWIPLLFSFFLINSTVHSFSVDPRFSQNRQGRPFFVARVTATNLYASVCGAINVPCRISNWVLGEKRNTLSTTTTFQSRVPTSTALAAQVPSSRSDLGEIEYQADCGRGEDHLSAFLEEGDVVVYQTGTWMVDGVEVGTGGDPEFHYCQMETLQLVWTHNCEHGVVRGYELQAVNDDGDEDSSNGKSAITALVPVVDENDNEVVVEFGPEQLIARIPVEWEEIQQDDKSKIQRPPRQKAIPAVSLFDDLWLQASEVDIE